MNPWYSLEGKTIWVTGGAGYLGSPITEALDGLAAQTICIDQAEKAADLVRTRKLSKTAPVTLNVSDIGALDDGLDKLAQLYGPPDGVVHLAYSSSAGKKLDELSSSAFQQTLEFTLPPTFVLCRKAADLTAV